MVILLFKFIMSSYPQGARTVTK